MFAVITYDEKGNVLSGFMTRAFTVEGNGISIRTGNDVVPRMHLSLMQYYRILILCDGQNVYELNKAVITRKEN